MSEENKVQDSKQPLPLTRALAPVLYLLDEAKTGNVIEPEADASMIEVFTPNGWSFVRADTLQVGHIVRVLGRGKAPADMILIQTSNSDSKEAYIQTKHFNGEDKLRLRKTAPLPSSVLSLLDTSEAELDPAGLVLLTSQQFQVCEPTPKLSKFYGSVIAENGHEVKLDLDHFVAAGATLLLTDWIWGVVVYTGSETKYALIGGAEGAKGLTAKRKEKKEKEKADAKAREEETKKKKFAEVHELTVAQRAARFEEQTGVKWSHQFVNVPDDGNCLLHAFWLGLKTLLEYYPQFKLTPDETLPKDPASFRSEVFNRLASDMEYMGAIQQMLMLYVEGIEESYLLCMEDFYVLPEPIRDQIMAMKLQNNMAIEMGEACVLEYDALLANYVMCLREPTNVNGRDVYVPLGALELSGLCRIYSVRLQTMTTEGVFQALSAITIDEIDPRAVPRACIHEQDSPISDPSTPVRLVRLLNVKRNHYNVHLPCPAHQEQQASFSSDHYWRDSDYVSSIQLQPLD